MRVWSRAAPPTEPAAVGQPASLGQPCGSLGRVLSRVFRQPKPEILNLGPLCGDSVVYLAGRGARVHVEEVEPPPPLPQRKPGQRLELPAPFVLEQPDRSFDLVLVWELADFVPPDRLGELGAEVLRVLHEGGWVFITSFATKPCEQEPLPRYRLMADDLIMRLPTQGMAHRRFTHQNRDLERALRGMSVQGIQLQRNQLREISALKQTVG